jgi:hypothetical protein
MLRQILRRYEQDHRLIMTLPVRESEYHQYFPTPLEQLQEVQKAASPPAEADPFFKSLESTNIEYLKYLENKITSPPGGFAVSPTA